MPFQLRYASTARHEMRRDDLAALLQAARPINTQNGVTGLLLYGGGRFLQVLEGDEAAARETFARIRDDSRHFHIRVLFQTAISQPQFAELSMGFQALDGSDRPELPGADGQVKDLRGAIEDYGRARDFLLMMRWRGLDPAKELATRA